MFPGGQRGLTKGSPPGGPEARPVRKLRGVYRAVVREPHPAIRSVLEYLLSRQGYAVEVAGVAAIEPGPALVLVSAGDGGGLYVFECDDAAEALERTSGDDSLEAFSGVTGVRAFLPKPFGADDVLRVVRAVDGFDGRRRERSRSV